LRFPRHDGIYRSDVVQVKTKTKTKPWGGTVPPPVGRPRAQVKERVGRTTLSSSSSMSSGRLFLDRVGRHLYWTLIFGPRNKLEFAAESLTKES